MNPQKPNTFDVRVEGERVALTVNGRWLMSFGWRIGNDICQALDQRLRGDGASETGAVAIGGGNTVSFITAGDVVLWLNDGAMAFSAVKDDMREIWRAVTAGCRKAEEFAKAELVIADNAILFRSGAPFGLSDHPKILEETVKAAQHDRDLRRFMPGGIRSTELHGTPTLIGDMPAIQRARRLRPTERRQLRALLLAKGN